jgi:hypothetical protein
VLELVGRKFMKGEHKSHRLQGGSQ